MTVKNLVEPSRPMREREEAVAELSRLSVAVEKALKGVTNLYLEHATSVLKSSALYTELKL